MFIMFIRKNPWKHPSKSPCYCLDHPSSDDFDGSHMGLDHFLQLTGGRCRAPPDATVGTPGWSGGAVETWGFLGFPGLVIASGKDLKSIEKLWNITIFHS